jgi:nucleolar protein 56
MKVYVVDTPFGLFALNKAGKVIDKCMFSSNPSEASSMLREIESGDLPTTVSEFFVKLNKAKYKPLVVDNETILKAVKAKAGLEPELEKPSTVGDKFREQLVPVLIGLNVVKDEADFNRFVRDVTLQMARAGVAVSAARRDQHAIQTVRALDDLDKTLNLFSGRTREWYGLHFPEMDRLIEGQDTYVRLVADLGKRSNFTVEALEKEGLPKEKVQALAEAARRSMGAEIEEDDLDWLRVFCNQTLDLFKIRDRAEKYLEDLMKNVAPNMSFLLGSTLSAKLISLAGSLDRLAMMPASTLQVLGAEKALFRALKTGARPPKHGIIFQYAAIHQAPRWQRGKIARALSGRLSIAARIDAFKGEFRGEVLKKGLEKRINEIKEKYSNPPMRTKYGSPRR